MHDRYLHNHGGQWRVLTVTYIVEDLSLEKELHVHAHGTIVF